MVAASITSFIPQPGAFARLHLSVLLQKPSDVLMVTWCKASGSQTTETLITTGCFHVHDSELSQGQDREWKASRETAVPCFMYYLQSDSSPPIVRAFS